MYCQSAACQSFHFQAVVAKLDNKLLSIKVPNCVSRLPKSLGDIKHWKGMFVLYVCIDILHDCTLLCFRLRVPQMVAVLQPTSAV